MISLKLTIPEKVCEQKDEEKSEYNNSEDLFCLEQELCKVGRNHRKGHMTSF